MQEAYSRQIFKDGATIFSQGDRAGEAYLIQKGNVRLQVNEKSQTREIDTVGPGKIFGEMGVISDMNRMATATAVGDVEVINCQRLELQRRIDELSEDRRDALRFLIVYCQDLLPFELMGARPDDEEMANRDKIAFYLIKDANTSSALNGLDPFLSGLYKVLIGYAERRLPPDFEPALG